MLVRRRPEKGLLGGMLELPGTPWRADEYSTEEALAHAPRTGLDWQARPGVAQHGFTHRDLTMRVMTARVPELPEGVPLDRAARSLPSAMKKLLPLL
jgi:A/G-specific adenine glycosylase